jgi:Family of unknown function (DUF6010)
MFVQILPFFAPVLVAMVYIALVTRISETACREFNAIFVAGAGAAYLSGGFNLWELPFTAVMSVLAYRGLRDYRYTGFAWLLHTCWDLVHHFQGKPIIPCLPGSSLGCAICDPVIALWCFSNGGSARVVSGIPRCETG